MNDHSSRHTPCAVSRNRVFEIPRNLSAGGGSRGVSKTRPRGRHTECAYYYVRAAAFALLALAVSADTASAVVPPIPPVIVVPAAPDEKPDGDEPDDVAKLADRIGKNAKGVTEKLGEQDTGDATRRDQQKLKQDLDKLIDLLQNQPPPPMSNDSSQQPPPPSGGGGMGNKGGNPPPMGGGSGQQKPMGGSRRSGSGRKQEGQPMPMGGTGDKQPMPMGNKGEQPMPAGAKPDDKGQPMNAQPTGDKGGDAAGTGGKATPTLPLAETIAKDFWGHLPEVPRQRMMQFFKEQYNSRYKDLLPDYFSTLAEKEKKGKK